MKWSTASGVVLSMWLGAGVVHAEPKGTVELWTRGAPGRPGEEPERQRVQVVELSEWKEALTTVVQRDAQYDAPKTFRGVALEALVRRYGGYRPNDWVLLHFDNGMVIPLPVPPNAVWKELEPLVALQVQVKSEEGLQWTRTFPEVRKRGAEARDRRPIVFRGNKLVVSRAQHPLVPKGAAFSPWRHADALWGVELVRPDAYWKQFVQDGSAQVARGFKVFQTRCHFCHAVGGVGGHFGWDFLEPVPLTRYRTPQTLFLHARYREGDAPERGLMMPALSDLSEAEADALWKWVERSSQDAP